MKNLGQSCYGEKTHPEDLTRIAIRCQRMGPQGNPFQQTLQRADDVFAEGKLCRPGKLVA